MNNEEKILSMLESMANDMGDMKTDINDMKGRLATIEKNELKTNLIIENEIKHNIQLLAEGQKGLVDRLWNIPNEIEDIKESVSILDFIQKTMVQNKNK